MSGGSYDYLCFHDFLDMEDHLRRMAERLLELGSTRASDETYRVLHELRDIDQDQRLRDAWQAVEWLDSGDRGIDGTIEALRELGWT